MHKKSENSHIPSLALPGSIHIQREIRIRLWYQNSKNQDKAAEEKRFYPPERVKKMDIRMRLSVFCCIAACMLTVAVPLISEATYGGRGAEAGVKGEENWVYIPVRDTEGGLPEEKPEEAGSGDSAADVPPEDTGEIPVYEGSFTVTVLNAKTGKTSEMELEDYIACVVAAEMPYTFNIEAMKAQAVAARSYCLYKILNGSGHDDADVCTSYAHCAAFVSDDSLADKYGEGTAKKILKKVREAVEATSGQVITYKGKPALALFHSRSWKYTESSVNVWGGKLPYLVSVSTPEEDSVSTVTVSESELKKLFQSNYAVKVSSSSGTAVLTSEMNDTGRQSSVFYGGSELKAKKLRTLLGLKSCDFEYEKTAEGWVFTVHGYGHGVGMSQYGANEMAKNGSGYAEILTHYYSGVSIGTIDNIRALWE